MDLNICFMMLARMKYGKKQIDRRLGLLMVESTEGLKLSISSSSNNSQQSSKHVRRSSIDIIRNTMNRNNLFLSVAQINIMLTKMVVIICVFSTLEHLFLILSQLMFTDYLNTIKSDVIFLANISMLINNSHHLFIFYYFNAFFKVRFNRLVLRN